MSSMLVWVLAIAVEQLAAPRRRALAPVSLTAHREEGAGSTVIANGGERHDITSGARCQSLADLHGDRRHGGQLRRQSISPAACGVQFGYDAGSVLDLAYATRH